MDFDEMTKAVNQASQTINMADNMVGRMAALIVGRLRKSSVSGSVLKSLKKELQDYNMHTGMWKDE